MPVRTSHRIGLVAAILAGAVSAVVVPAAAPVAHAAAGDFAPVAPARLLDTRAGQATVDGAHAGVGALGPASTYTLPVRGRGGVPAGAVTIAINITAPSTTEPTVVTAYPGGDRPNASNLNPVPGVVTHNTTQLPIAADGTITLYNHAGDTHLVVDVLGSYSDASCFAALPPARLLDTRTGGTTVDGAHAGSGALGAGATYHLPVSGRGAVAAGAVAVAVNVTAMNTTSPTFVTAYPGGTRPGAVTHNTTQLPVAADGTITLFNAVGATDVVVDVLGAYTSTACFTAITPARLLDTRAGHATADGLHQATGALGDAATYTLPVRGRSGIPAWATGVAVNITAPLPSAPTFVTAYPGTERPTASNLNPSPGVVTHNTTQLPIAPDGTITLYQHTGSADLVVDVLGYYGSGAILTPPGVHPRIYLPGAGATLTASLAQGAPSATRFKAYADARRSTSFQSLYDSDFRMWYFALLANLTGDATYCTRAVDGIDWFVTGEEQRIASFVSGQPATGPRAAYDSYLEIGPLVGDVMMVYDWCFDAVSAGRRSRWLAYADRAVWNVWHPDDAQWGGKPAAWSGWSVDNPSNNYYYSFLRATMLLGLGAEGELASAAGWKAFFRTTKIQQQLVPTFDRDLVGGGSREGTGYGTAMMRLWEVYDLWEESTGENIASLTGHSRASLVQFLHLIVPTLDAVSLNGDHSRDSTGALFDYHRHYAQSLAKVIGDAALAGRVRDVFGRSSVPTMQNGFMVVHDFLYDLTATPAQSVAALGTVSYGSGVGQLYARSDWSTQATWLNITAGPYTESHAHRDQGSFLLFRDRWLAIDPNFYSHSGIRNEEELHNLVRVVDGGGGTVTQRYDTSSTVQALRQGDGWLHVAADSTAVYGASSPVQRMQREWVFVEPDVLVVYDRVTTSPGTTQRWQLNVPTAPSVAGSTATVIAGATTMRSRRVIPDAASVSTFDWTTDPDMSGGFRLDETVAGGANTFLHVLSFGTAVTSATRGDAGGRQGVIISFADGRTATVRFSPTDVDGTLSISGPGGTTSVSLLPGVQAPPELAAA
jgi:hypothetical protein